MNDRPTPENPINIAMADEIIILAKQRDTVIQDRDTLRAEVARAEAKIAAEYEAHKMTQCERDALKSEVERLNVEITAMNGIVSLAEWAHTCVHHTTEERALVFCKCPVCANAEVESLKADKARLESDLKEAGFAIFGAVIKDTMKGDK